MQSEQQIVGRLQNGDGCALGPLMDLHGNHIYRTAFLLMKDHHMAEDISQDVFLTAYRKIGQYRGEGSLRNWLVRIAVNTCRSRMRRASWRKLLFRDISAEELPAAEPGLEQAAAKHTLAGHIGRLPYAYKEVVVLHYYQELSVGEIARLLREKENTIKSRLLRGRAMLKKELLEGGWNDD